MMVVRCCRKASLGVLLVLIFLGVNHALVMPLLPKRKNAQYHYRSTSTVLSQADTSSSSETTDVVNGDAGGIILQNADEKTRLASAFAALDEGDQYDAVLTGLCAKILDDTEESKALSSLQDPISLLTEMNTRKVAASGRSLMALVDAAAKTHDARAMAHVLSLCLVNGGLSEYGSLQADLVPLPTMPASRVKCPDGSTKTRQQRLDSLPDIPVDDRATEVVSALAVCGVVGFCGVCNVLGFDELTVYTNVILTLLITVGVVDNFYDVLKGALALAKTQLEMLEKIQVPEKDEMPLSLGTGQVSGTVVRGLTRLINVDTERECQCEAAAFFAAYSLGLPCFAFRPNALEAAVLVLESMKKNPDASFSDDAIKLDPLLSNVGILKVLVWLLAPVAMESSKHLQLIVSDPREGAGFLERLSSKSELLEEGDLFWQGQEEDLLKWAYAEADLLLRENKNTLTELTERLAGGAATVGDCVAVLEKW